MSTVTSIILTVGCLDDVNRNHTAPWLDKLNSFLADDYHPPLANLTDVMSTEKHPQTYTVGGGINGLDNDGFIEELKKIKWRSPENVVLVLQPEEGATIVWRPIVAQPVVPDGWSLVPKEPTPEMVKAMVESRARDDEGEFPALHDLIDFSGENKTRAVIMAAYRALLAAAPDYQDKS